MHLDRTNPDHLKERLRALGAWSKKSLGQHFLIDPSVLDVILEAAAVSRDDTVLEIGPGPGVLTERLLERAGRVIAFEFDQDMVRLLQEDFPQLELIPGDVLKTAPQCVPGLGSYKLVANIPYQITTPLLRLFLEGGIEPRPTGLTLLVQKEVGKRLAALERQPDRGYLSVLSQYFSEVSYVATVPSAAFWPAPKVDSAVVHFALRAQRQVPIEHEHAFLRFVHTLFINPRKQLKNVVAGIRGIDHAAAAEYLQGLGLPEFVRAQELSVDDWVRLFNQPIS